MQEKDIIAAQAKTLVNVLSQAGIETSLSTAYDAISRLCGSKDWNALSARLRATAPGTKRQPESVVSDAESSEPSNPDGYRLLVLRSHDGESYSSYALVPSTLELEEVKEAFAVWLDEQRVKDRDSNGEDSYTDRDIYLKLKELGCKPFWTAELGPIWD